MNYRFENSRGRLIPESSVAKPLRSICAALKPEHALLAHLAGVLIMVAFIAAMTGTVAVTLRTMLLMF